jgi:predicted DNA-binding transcriptional regulator AlpA
MPVQIAGVEYFSADEVADAVGVSRQTLWRWRTDGRIPAGNRYRDRQIVFTAGEFEVIRQFACRVEPVSRGGTPSATEG